MDLKRRIARYVSREREGKGVGGELGDRELDVRIACEVMGYRWQEWNHAVLRGGPLDAPGRFLSSGDGPLAHMQRPAAADAPPSAWPLLEVPRFTSRIQDAWSAVAHAGLFDSAGLLIVHLESGDWQVRRNGGTVLANADSACLALALAALHGSADLGNGTGASGDGAGGLP